MNQAPISRTVQEIFRKNDFSPSIAFSTIFLVHLIHIILFATM